MRTPVFRAKSQIVTEFSMIRRFHIQTTWYAFSINPIKWFQNRHLVFPSFLANDQQPGLSPLIHFSHPVKAAMWFKCGNRIRVSMPPPNVLGIRGCHRISRRGEAGYIAGRRSDCTPAWPTSEGHLTCKGATAAWDSRRDLEADFREDTLL
jgi:hypothetical protein